MTTTLSRQALNRATLARQHLLEPAAMPVTELVAHVGGLQAQTTHTWYVGLFSRLGTVDASEVGGLLESRALVRMALMRSTIHLVTPADALDFRPLVATVIERSTRGAFGRHWRDLDLAAVAAAGRELVDAEPRTFSDLGRELAARWPDRDPAALAQAVRTFVPLVQVPPRGVWGRSGRALHTSVEHWLDRPIATGPPVAGLVRRYLAAFGPATVRDAQQWCGLTKLAEVFEELRPSLVTFRDEDGAELFDLPDAPRPPADVPAPPRFLYDYDNLLLSHADRRRVVDGVDYAAQGFDAESNRQPSSVLLDGVVAATWTVTRVRSVATLTVRPFGRLSDVDALEAEGRRLLGFLEPRATSHAVVIEP